ncbi:MAG TPA: hypothetical protein VNQ55_02650 [Parapedobacter sp.]|nr:hypothetical protein [Parapedobacter sp.]
MFLHRIDNRFHIDTGTGGHHTHEPQIEIVVIGHPHNPLLRRSYP